MRKPVVAFVALVAVLVGMARPADASNYDDPFFVGWTQYLPPSPVEYPAGLDPDASVEDDGPCQRGSVHCVEKVIHEMTRRWRSLGCDHNGVFALTYLITTIQYHDAVTTPGFFSDTAWLNHYDAVFADYYFRPVDAWDANQLAEVSPAWRIAFHAADNDLVTGYGDVMLGMNAHIIRDLPFVLFQIGLEDTAGNSRKADHDRVNEFLNEAGKIVINRVASVYDPTIDDNDYDGSTLDNSATINLIQEWREEAWRKAELLKATPPLLRASVVKMIEDDAASRAMSYVDLYSATPEQTAARDAHCAANFPQTNSAQEQAILTAI